MARKIFNDLEMGRLNFFIEFGSCLGNGDMLFLLAIGCCTPGIASAAPERVLRM